MTYPETILLRGGDGMRETLQEAADRSDISMQEFMRRCMVAAMEEVGVRVPPHLKKPSPRRWRHRPQATTPDQRAI